LANTGPSEVENSPVLLVVDARADQVGRHQVGRELDALEPAAHRIGQRLHRQGLGQPGNAFDQQVAARQHRDHHALEKTVLADDHALHLVEDLLHQLGGGSGGGGGARFVLCAHACCFR
jgi:hypothetical protein